MGNVKNTDKREISHMGIVKNNMGEPLRSYARISNHLGDKLGPLLFDTLMCYFQNMSTFKHLISTKNYSTILLGTLNLLDALCYAVVLW